MSYSMNFEDMINEMGSEINQYRERFQEVEREIN